MLVSVSTSEIMESDQDTSRNAIEAVPVPDLATRAASARENANLAQNPGVIKSKIT